MRSFTLLALNAAAAVGLCAGAASAATYDLASAFSGVRGPLWYYGVYSASGFTPFPNFNPPTSSAGPGALEGWDNHASEVLGTPADAFNTSASEIQCSCGTVVTLPHQALFHPGQHGEIASYELVAPVSGKYRLSAEFSGRDFVGPTDTQVSIVDGFGTTPIFIRVVNGYAGSSTIAAFGPSPAVAFNDSLQLSKGDQVFFNVAWDPHGTRRSGPWFYDSTAIGATLTIPEPSTWLLMAIGLAGLGLAAHRRSRGPAASVSA
jgi:hypothetical protein